MVIRHDDSNEDDEDFDDFSDIEPELVQLNHRGRGLSDTGKHFYPQSSIRGYENCFLFRILDRVNLYYVSWFF